MEKLNFGYNINQQVTEDLRLTIMKGSRIGALIRIDRGEPAKGGKHYQFTLVSDIDASIRDRLINSDIVESYSLDYENRTLNRLLIDCLNKNSSI